MAGGARRPVARPGADRRTGTATVTATDKSRKPDTGDNTTPQRGRRLRTFTTGLKLPLFAAVFMAVAVATGGCGLVGDGKQAEEIVQVTPDDRARGVSPGAAVRVSVAEGRLRSVRLVRRGDGAEHPVRGRMSAGGRVWRPLARDGELHGGRGALAPSSRYSVQVVAVGADGERIARNTTFTTKVPKHRFIGFFRPEHRQTVGTGMIVSLDFNRPVTDRAAVERAVRVTAEPSVPVAAHWFGGTRLDFRPREPWRPGTRVTLDLRLRGVRGAPGAYGVQRKKVWFRVGRDQRTTIDVARREMTVERDGRRVSTVPVTAGTPENPTYNGTMVISEKYDVTRMNGSTVGFGGEYDISDVPHAMRLTTSGTFLHGNYWARSGVFGRKNTSHGCVGLEDEKGGSDHSPAGRFFRNALVGDLVTVQGSRSEKGALERTVAPDNGLGGWNMSWERWTAGSALN